MKPQMYYAVKDRRYGFSPRSKKGWIVQAEFNPLEGEPLMEIPESIQSHWDTNKNSDFNGVCEIRGLTTDDLLILTRLLRGGVATVFVARYGLVIQVYQLLIKSA